MPDGADRTPHVDGPIYVAPSPIAGRGMFAAKRIKAGTNIHVAPVILLDDDDHDTIDATGLTGYVYEWYEGGVAFALGYGSLFNHASDPNCKYELTDEEHPAWPAMEYTTVRDVAKGEELTIGYVDDVDDLWFDPAD
jgi:SET domain-containing protein